MIERTNGCLESYIRAIRAGEIVAGHELRDMLDSLESDMEGDRWIYDTAEADRRMRFMEGCVRLTKAPFFGKPMALLPWQKAFLSAVYGFKHPEDGTDRFQRILLLCGRKNAKSELASALILADMLIGGEGRDIVCSSNDDIQASILYDATDTMRQLVDPDSLDTWRNNRGLTCTANRNRVRKLSQKSHYKDGYNLDVAVIDEIHEMRDNSIVKAIEQSQSLKPDPKLIMITTEGFVNGGFLDEELTRARRIVRGESESIADERYLPWLYTQDSETEVWDGNRVNRLWEKSNPSLGAIKRWSYLEQQVDLARGSKSDRVYVLAKDFNIKQSNAEAWLLPEQYSYAAPVDPEELRGGYCLGGVDIAETTDLTAAVAVVMKPGDPRKYVLTQYWVPEAKLEQSDDRTAGARYPEWARSGAVRIMPGNYLDAACVADWFLELYRDHGIRPLKVGYDVRFATAFLQRMEEYGFDSELVYQSPEVMDLPIKMLEADLKSRHVRGLGPVDRWCLGNASLKVDSRQHGLLVKIDGQASRRIDGAVALVIAWEMWRRNRTDYTALIGAQS